MEKAAHNFLALGLSILLLFSSSEIQAQANQSLNQSPSAKGAFFRSMLVPGWGHKYANQGEWNTGAKFHTGVEAVLWTGLVSSIRGESQVIQSYESFAASRAGVKLDGKSRAFVLNVANYSSDETYREALLRNRAWDAIDGASDPEFNWEWDSEEDRNEFRRLREDADALDRRQTFMIVSLLGNRLVSGFNSLRSARKQKKSFSARLSPIYDGLSPIPTIYLSASISL